MERAAKLFNGTHTIESPRGGHRTFEIRTVVADPKLPSDHFKNKFAGRRIVKLLIGPDNTTNFKQIGWVNEEGIQLTQKHADSRDMKATVGVLWSLAVEGAISPYHVMGYRLLTAGRCLRCNRKLTVPESILNGIGPVCAGKM